MREIKFRAWDKKEKCWAYGDLKRGLAGFFEAINKGELDENTLCQHTGFEYKDWWEKDIIQIPDEGLFIIEWKDAKWVALHVKKGYFKELHVAWLSGGKVIGNIYENPELIAEGKDEGD